MKFRTEYIPEKSTVSLSPDKPVVLAGSCFSKNMAEKMNSFLWKAVNPLGTLFNPMSISMALTMMTDEKEGVKLFEESLFLYNGIWNSHAFDSSFSAIEREDCVKEFLLRQKEFNESLTSGKILIVTFGTSICYHLNEDGKVVGNCHKQPSDMFYRKRMTVDDISACFNPCIAMLKKRFPGIKIIFTVSPVRHLKDGFSGNARSKALLLLGVEELCRENKDCWYFPAYEIILDDLRDYRFYSSDLVHPSEEGIDYVWEKFCQTYVDEYGMSLLKDGAKKVKASLHQKKRGALGKLLAK